MTEETKKVTETTETDDTAASVEKENNQQEEKTFTEAEVNKIVKERLARERKNLLEKKSEGNKKSDNPPDEGAENLKKAELKAKNAEQRAATAEVKAGLLANGFDSAKINRAIKLVDVESVMVDGEVDEDLLSAELDELAKDFPELKKATETQTVGKIGAEKNVAATVGGRKTGKRIF
jgi:hypothetical protein